MKYNSQSCLRILLVHLNLRYDNLALILELIQSIDKASLWSAPFHLYRNEFLIQEGQAETHLYWVLDGSLRMYVESEEEEHTIRFGYQNDLVTALDSFIHEGPTTLYIQALRKCSLRKVAKARFMQWIESDLQRERNWRALLGAFILQQMERERDLLITSPKERYERVLKRSPQLFQEIPHKHIAAYLRMTPETLSRMKK